MSTSRKSDATTDNNHREPLKKWWIYQGGGLPDPKRIDEKLPPPPRWRHFAEKETDQESGKTFQADGEQIELVNAALYLRRPLLVTGMPGTGKSSLAESVAYELGLGKVIRWPITSRSTVAEALYRYDAIGRLHARGVEDGIPEIGDFIHLGQLGTALLPAKRPRVLLIDEIDKGDIDLPNDLLNIFEEGWFEIPELKRLAKMNQSREMEHIHVPVTTYDGTKATVLNGRIICDAFPFVIITSNGERELPGPFLRRCLSLRMEPPKTDKLSKIVAAHFQDIDVKVDDLIAEFLERRSLGDLATDQLLNAIHMRSAIFRQTGESLQAASIINIDNNDKTPSLLTAIWRKLSTRDESAD